MADWLKSVLASDGAFVGFSIAALIATAVVAVGLFLEYERHELIGRSRKQIGSLMVAGGVAFEALFGVAVFTSAIIRETKNQTEILDLQKRLRQVSPRNELLAEEPVTRELVSSLSKFPCARVAIFISLLDTSEWIEARQTAIQIGYILMKSEWCKWTGDKLESASDAGFPMHADLNSFSGNGVVIEVDNAANDRTKQAATALRDGLGAHINVMPGIGKMGRELHGRIPDPKNGALEQQFDPNTIFITVFGHEPSFQYLEEP